MFRLFHRTEVEWAQAIMREGFKEDVNNSIKSAAFMGSAGSGVFLSDIPVNCQDGAKGESLIELVFSVSEDEIASRFELVYEQEGQPFREFLIPAEFINAHAKLRLISGEEIEELESWASDVRLQRAKIDQVGGVQEEQHG